MGGKWVLYNEMTERIEILYVRKTHRQIYRQKWTQWREWSDNAKKATKMALTMQQNRAPAALGDMDRSPTKVAAEALAEVHMVAADGVEAWVHLSRGI